MQEKATVPIIIVAVIAAVVLVAMLGRSFLSGPPTNTGEHHLPSFIDPATGKPRPGMNTNSSGQPLGQGPGGMSMPNSGSAGSGPGGQ